MGQLFKECLENDKWNLCCREDRQLCISYDMFLSVSNSDLIKI